MKCQILNHLDQIFEIRLPNQNCVQAVHHARWAKRLETKLCMACWFAATVCQFPQMANDQMATFIQGVIECMLGNWRAWGEWRRLWGHSRRLLPMGSSPHTWQQIYGLRRSLLSLHKTSLFHDHRSSCWHRSQSWRGMALGNWRFQQGNSCFFFS